MIVSQRHRLVFVKARKVGGTSVEMALSSICGPDDIVSGITPIDEACRLAEGGAARNFAIDPTVEAAYLAELRRAPARAAAIAMPPVRFDSHMTLREIERARDVAGYACVGVLRQPCGHAVSWATHKLRFADYRRDGAAMRAPPDDIRAMVDHLIESGDLLTIRLAPYYASDRGTDVALLRFEHLQDDLSALARSMRLDLPPLPFAKPGMRLSEDEATDLLRPDQRATVRRLLDPDYLIQRVAA